METYIYSKLLCVDLEVVAALLSPMHVHIEIDRGLTNQSFSRPISRAPYLKGCHFSTRRRYA